MVETEVAGRETVPGILLRALARNESVSSDELCASARERVAEDVVRAGSAAKLTPDELTRRAEEAAHVIVQLIAESGLVAPMGDLTAASAYSLPDGAICRVLRAQASVNKLRPA